MSLDLELDLQVVADGVWVPSRAQLERFSAAALDGRRERAELTIRVVDEQESRALNLRYRGQDKPTNVLSFPFEPPPGIAQDSPVVDLLGDLVICAGLVQREALDQGKETLAHWAHLVVHGILHLIDYDHLGEAEAAEMEGLETAVLQGLGFPPPYEEISLNP